MNIEFPIKLIQTLLLMRIVYSDIKHLHIPPLSCFLIYLLEIINHSGTSNSVASLKTKIIALASFGVTYFILQTTLNSKRIGNGDILLLGTLLLITPITEWSSYFFLLSVICFAYWLLLRHLLHIHHQTLIPFAPLLCASHWIQLL